MDRRSNFAVIAIALVLVATIGAAFLYAENSNLRQERDALAVRVELGRSLMDMRSGVQGELASASDELAKAVALLRSFGLNGSEARAIMGGVLANVSHSIDVVTIDLNGIIVASEPAAYHGAEGVDISDQEQVIRMLDSHLPVMSRVFMMVEGFMAADMQSPIFDQEGVFIGSLSVTLDIEALIRERAEELGLSVDLQITCLQDDGPEIFDTDEGQIGRNLFTDPAYADHTETLEFMHHVLETGVGYGTYEYYDSLESGKLVSKEVCWEQFGVHGEHWTLLFIHVL